MNKIENRYWNIYFTLTECVEYDTEAQRTAFVTAIKNAGRRLGIQRSQERWQQYQGGHFDPTHVNQ